jgi:hypothetical protein
MRKRIERPATPAKSPERTHKPSAPERPRSRSSADKPAPGSYWDRDLPVGKPGDAAERAADAMAARALTGAAPPSMLAPSTLAPAPGGVHGLDQATRDYFEPRFGADFSNVRIHDDANAHHAALRLGASAFSVDENIAFASGQFSPATERGRQLLAHELAHVVQQQQTGDAVIRRQVNPQAAFGPALPDVDATVEQLDLLLGPVVFADREHFFVEGVTTTLTSFCNALDTASAAARNAPPPKLAHAVDEAAAELGPKFTSAASEIRESAVNLTSESSLVKPGRITAPRFPTAPEANALIQQSARLNQLSRDPSLPVSQRGRQQLADASAALADAALATMQALSVEKARAIWRTGTATQDPPTPLAAGRAHNEVDRIFSDSGFDKYGIATQPSGALYDWCGMFVATALFRSDGLAKELRGGFWETSNVGDFFNYTQTANAARVPLAIWAEGRWWDLRDYHTQRRSKRQWTDRNAIGAQLLRGNADIRPGDVCLINHAGGNDPQHIVMVESYDRLAGILVTIEGNTRHGIRANAQGDVTRLPNSQAIAASGAGVAQSTLHLRDLDSITPAVAATHGAAIPPQAGAAAIESGATVLGVGRLSLVDFEAHEYAVQAVPAILRTLSPDQIRALAARAGVTDPQEQQQKRAAQQQVQAKNLK